MTKAGDRLRVAIAEAVERVKNMTPEEHDAMVQAQKESWVRAMSTGCEHGVLDFETCPECRS